MSVTTTEREKMSVDIRMMQAQVTHWSQANWPDDTDNELFPHLKALKMCEEAGEVAGAIIKQGRPGVSKQDIADELGDLFITMCGVAEACNINLESAIEYRWHFDVAHRGPKGGK